MERKDVVKSRSGDQRAENMLRLWKGKEYPHSGKAQLVAALKTAQKLGEPTQQAIEYLTGEPGESTLSSSLVHVVLVAFIVL